VAVELAEGEPEHRFQFADLFADGAGFSRDFFAEALQTLSYCTDLRPKPVAF
jgi:hypothetical protein